MIIGALEVPSIARLSTLLSSITLIFLLCGSAAAQTRDKPVRSVIDPGVVTTRQSITPAGIQTVFSGRVYGVTFGSSSSELFVLTSQKDSPVYRMDWGTNRVIESIPLKRGPGLQGIQFDPVSGKAFISGIFKDRTAKPPKNTVQFLRLDNGGVKVVADELGANLAGAPGVAVTKNPKGQRLAVVPLTFNDELAVIDLEGNRVVSRIKTGIAPFGAVVNRESSVAYVTNWGGHQPEVNDNTAPTGYDAHADHVVVDGRGIASTGTVSRLDLLSDRVTDTIAVGLHPTALAWDEQNRRLYVANSNEDSVSVVDTVRNVVAATFSIQPFVEAPRGISPTAIAVSRDGQALFVACAGINAVAVIDAGIGRIEGLIPTGWYPNSLSLSTDGNYLAVSTLFGVGSGWQSDSVKSIGEAVGLEWQLEPTNRYVHANRGSVHVIRTPDAGQLASYTLAVAENNHLSFVGAGNQKATSQPAEADPSPVPIPLRAGDPSLIEHVVYIVKENRAYDQVFGDMTKGNGDPSLVMFGANVTPNHHRLADQFVLLDNFYATGGNSGDGHQWVTQANETTYCYWPGYSGRSYPFDGSDPIAYSSGGFIWDAALKANKTVQIFGEYVGLFGYPGPPLPPEYRSKLLEEWKTGTDFSGRYNTIPPIAGLNKIVAQDFPAWSLMVPDIVRAQIFLKHLERWEATGLMPNLVIMCLPGDHTFGTTPGEPTPKASLADNDLALGQIVEGLSKTAFWKNMAIFVVEDDAQGGVDHVDGHRTVAFAISPYTRHGSVDSTFYSHPSILKTIELILGLPTLSLFDLIANDMRNGFAEAPDFTPYHALLPTQSMFEVNPALSALRGVPRTEAAASKKMNFGAPDAAPAAELNRILWHATRGSSVRYPSTKQSVFAPYALQPEEDDDKER